MAEGNWKEVIQKKYKEFFNKQESSIVAFYMNEKEHPIIGENIDTILENWRGKEVLETNHSYIQWLFPNRVPSKFNLMASVLTDEDVKAFQNSPEMRNRLKRAFEMMLEFYGMKLSDENEIELAENSEERLRELNKWQNHNYLRITRILLALKELGHANLMLPWMKLLADLVYGKKLLNTAERSFEDFWICTLEEKDKKEIEIHVKELKRINNLDEKELPVTPTTSSRDSSNVTLSNKEKPIRSTSLNSNSTDTENMVDHHTFENKMSAPKEAIVSSKMHEKIDEASVSTAINPSVSL